jgi:hypothetical protein
VAGAGARLKHEIRLRCRLKIEIRCREHSAFLHIGNFIRAFDEDVVDKPAGIFVVIIRVRRQKHEAERDGRTRERAKINRTSLERRLTECIGAALPIDFLPCLTVVGRHLNDGVGGSCGIRKSAAEAEGGARRDNIAVI